MNPKEIHWKLLFAVTLLVISRLSLAWGSDGHRVVGLLANTQLSQEARTRLQDIIGSDDPVVMFELCNWPDDYRATAEGEWSAPQHYINVPGGAERYLRDRDCGNGACSAEALKKYAIDLGDEKLPRETRRQAWAWVCHLTGDIHQPLHNGYGDDRGGNDTVVYLKGREMNLHHFWDQAMVTHNYPEGTQLATDLAPLLQAVDGRSWRPDHVDAWIEESHELVRHFGYPETPRLTRQFVAESWLLARKQMALAGSRLAILVNSMLGDRP